MDMRRAKRQVTNIELIKELVEEVQVVRLAINGEIYPLCSTSKFRLFLG